MADRQWALENARIDELTEELTQRQRDYIFLMLPIEADEDSDSVEDFLLNYWKAPVTPDTLRAFRMQFISWVENGYQQ